MPKSRTERSAALGVAPGDRVAQTAEEKRKLRATGASVVEMEAASVHTSARALGLPFFCVRAVTNLADETFANDLNACKETASKCCADPLNPHD